MTNISFILIVTRFLRNCCKFHCCCYILFEIFTKTNKSDPPKTMEKSLNIRKNKANSTFHTSLRSNFFEEPERVCKEESTIYRCNSCQTEKESFWKGFPLQRREHSSKGSFNRPFRNSAVCKSKQLPLSPTAASILLSSSSQSRE